MRVPRWPLAPTCTHRWRMVAGEALKQRDAQMLCSRTVGSQDAARSDVGADEIARPGSVDLFAAKRYVDEPRRRSITGNGRRLSSPQSADPPDSYYLTRLPSHHRPCALAHTQRAVSRWEATLDLLRRLLFIDLTIVTAKTCTEHESMASAELAIHHRIFRQSDLWACRANASSTAARCSSACATAELTEKPGCRSLARRRAASSRA